MEAAPASPRLSEGLVGTWDWALGASDVSVIELARLCNKVRHSLAFCNNAISPGHPLPAGFRSALGDSVCADINSKALALLAVCTMQVLG